MFHSSEQPLEGCAVLYLETSYGVSSAVQDTGETCRITIVFVRRSDRYPLFSFRYFYVASKVVVICQILANGIKLFIRADRLRRLQRRVFGILRVHQHSPIALLFHPTMQFAMHRLNTLFVFRNVCQVVEFPRVCLVVVKLDSRTMDKLVNKPIGPVTRLCRL